MTPSAKHELFVRIRATCNKYEEQGWKKDKKLLRYNDIAYAYRVFILMGNNPCNLQLDNLCKLCFKDSLDYVEGSGPLTWAWTWAIPTKSNIKKWL